MAEAWRSRSVLDRLALNKRSSPSTFLSLTDLDELARCLAAVGHPTRLRIVLCLRDGEDSPIRVAERLDDQNLGRVAHHFRRLARTGLIEQTRTRPRRGAVEHFYVLTPTGRQILERLGLSS
jgi:DNA-binding transcriptional ArsR family regulator